MIRGLRTLRYAVIALILIVVVWKFGASNANMSVPSYLKTSKPAAAVDHANAGLESAKKPVKEENLPEVALINRENATFVTLARNDDLWSLVGSIRQVEDRFNHKYHYDWVFLNDDEFTDEFKQVTTVFVSGKTHYGKIPKEHWGYPQFIDKQKAADTREKMRQDGIIYGHSESYRHMCRFESGFFWRNPALDQFKYYWRVEPHIKLTCDVDEDPFKYMRENNKTYGFTISLYEYEPTIMTLWETVKGFMKEYPHLLHKNNAMKFISDNEGENYNLCHFWSNFEIGDLDFWRGEAYRTFFDYLDHAGGFFYERWGDAPVHSIAAALLLDKNQIHFFDQIGYWHVPFQSCPVNAGDRLKHRCICPDDDSMAPDQRNIFTFRGYSCTKRWYTMLDKQLPKGWMDHSN